MIQNFFGECMFMKKIALILLMALCASTLFAYQGNFAVGVGLYADTDKDEFSDTKDSRMELSLMGSFMLENMEVAPYFILSNDKEYASGVLTDKYSDWGVGSQFNFHVVKTDIITLGTGIDASLRFGKYDEEFYIENSTFKFNAKLPIILDISLGSLVFRTTQPVAGYYYNSMDFSGTKSSSSTFYIANGFNPRFGLLLKF